MLETASEAVSVDSGAYGSKEGWFTTMAPLLDWAVERRHEGYRRLERKTAPEEALRLLTTVAPVRAQALYAALRAEVELFQKLRAVVLGHYGLTLGPTPEKVLESEMRAGAGPREKRGRGASRGLRASSCPRT